MIKMDWDNNFNLQISCQLQLPVEAHVKLELLSEFSKVYNKYEPFAKWIDNPEVPGKDKDPFNARLANAIAGLNFFYKFAKACGCTDEEIKEFTQIPF